MPAKRSLLLLGALLLSARDARCQEPDGKPPKLEGDAPAIEAPQPESAAIVRKPAAVAKTSPLLPDTDLIDVPTAGVIDQGEFSGRTRFFSGGGLMEWANFGIFSRLNLGTSLNVDKIIGTSSPVQVTRPDLQLKFRLYDGSRIIPALAIGFDGQGYLYNRLEKRYNQRQRGLYAIGSQEVGIPDLQLHAGVNISDFDVNKLFGILAASLNILDKALIMAEWDNINNTIDSRLNAGLRAYVTPGFYIDFSVRAIGQTGNYSNGVSRGPERIVGFKYTGSF